MKPNISVLMGIYNCVDTLSEAIDSILAQTCTGWELILCDDGSADGTYEVAHRYQQLYPEQIVLLKNDKNLGLNQTLNRCLEHARGQYIARMDGDDLSLPGRFEKELSFLEEHPDFDIVSCPMVYFDEHGDWGQGSAVELPQPRDFIHGTPFCHAPCMVRTDAIRSVGGYSTDRRTLRAEDYDLWFRMYENGSRGCNLQQPLYKMRDDMDAYHRRKFRYCLNEAYVRFTGYRHLRLSLNAYPYVLRPILVGLLPKRLYLHFHHRKKS